jgi:WD40 repeat protein
VILADAGWNLRVVELASGEETLIPSDPIGVASSLDCGPDWRTIVTTSATTRAHIRSLPEGRIVATLVHPSRVMYATYSPDKRWIATTANDSTVTIWDADTHEKRLEIQKAGYLGKRVSFGGGSVMVSWTPGGVRYAQTVLVGVYPLDVLAAAERASFGELTPDERDHFRVGSPEERRAKRRAWRDGHIYGDVGTASPLSP